MIVLSERCSGYEEILLDRAEQSSTDRDNVAANAIDNLPGTNAITSQEDPAWLRIYFKSLSTVEKVVVEKAHSSDSASVFTVLVYDGEKGTVCGTYITYTGKKG